MDKELLLTDEQRVLFLEMKAIPGKDIVKAVDVTTKDSEYYINLVDRAVTRFERIDSSFEKNSVVAKCCQTALPATENSFVKGGALILQMLLS